MRGIVAVGFIYLAFCCYAQAQTLPPEVFDRISNAIGGINISGIVPGVDLSGINKTALFEVAKTKVTELQNLLKEKCEKNGGPEAYNNAYAAKDDLIQCIKNLGNLTTLKQEMEQAKPTGDLDIVFKKYCDKRGTLEECISNFTAKLDPCLEPVEKENERILKNATHSVLDFICHKEGDRIALFIGSGGQECFTERRIDVLKCISSTYGHYVTERFNQSQPLTLESLPTIMFNRQTCSDAARTQACVVTELEKCEDPTPGNLMDSLMTFAKRQTPCDHILTSHSARSVGDERTESSAPTAVVQSLLLIVPVLLRLI